MIGSFNFQVMPDYLRAEPVDHGRGYGRGRRGGRGGHHGGDGSGRAGSAGDDKFKEASLGVGLLRFSCLI